MFCFFSDLELSTLAERLLDTRISDTDLHKDTSIRNISNNYIMLSKRMAKKNLNEDKVGALHHWHKNHKVITTKISKKNAIVVNSDISKDETFGRIISPNKQSTPYIHATPKKATTTIPRKSLFTITGMMNKGPYETDDVTKTETNNVSRGADKLLEMKSKSNVTPSSIDTVLKNNFPPTSSKVIVGNKIYGLEISNVSISSTILGDDSYYSLFTPVPHS